VLKTQICVTHPAQL